MFEDKYIVRFWKGAGRQRRQTVYHGIFPIAVYGASLPRRNLNLEMDSVFSIDRLIQSCHTVGHPGVQVTQGSDTNCHCEGDVRLRCGRNNRCCEASVVHNILPPETRGETPVAADGVCIFVWSELFTSRNRNVLQLCIFLRKINLYS